MKPLPCIKPQAPAPPRAPSLARLCAVSDGAPSTAHEEELARREARHAAALSRAAADLEARHADALGAARAARDGDVEVAEAEQAEAPEAQRRELRAEHAAALEAAADRSAVDAAAREAELADRVERHEAEASQRAEAHEAATAALVERHEAEASNRAETHEAATAALVERHEADVGARVDARVTRRASAFDAEAAALAAAHAAAAEGLADGHAASLAAAAAGEAERTRQKQAHAKLLVRRHRDERLERDRDALAGAHAEELRRTRHAAAASGSSRDRIVCDAARVHAAELEAARGKHAALVARELGVWQRRAGPRPAAERRVVGVAPEGVGVEERVGQQAPEVAVRRVGLPASRRPRGSRRSRPRAPRARGRRAPRPRRRSGRGRSRTAPRAWRRPPAPRVSAVVARVQSVTGVAKASHASSKTRVRLNKNLKSSETDLQLRRPRAPCHSHKTQDRSKRRMPGPSRAKKVKVMRWFSKAAAKTIASRAATCRESDLQL